MVKYLDQECRCCGKALWVETSREFYEFWGERFHEDEVVDSNVSDDRDDFCVDCAEIERQAIEMFGDDYNGLEDGRIVLCFGKDQIEYRDFSVLKEVQCV